MNSQQLTAHLAGRICDRIGIMEDNVRTLATYVITSEIEEYVLPDGEIDQMRKQIDDLTQALDRVLGAFETDGSSLATTASLGSVLADARHLRARALGSMHHG